MVDEYNVVIIGAGPAGYVAGLESAERGLKTLVIEKDQLGGVCLNRGCIPTKTLIESAKKLNYIKNADEFGIRVNAYELEPLKIWERKNRVVDQLRKGIEYLFKIKGVNLIKGEACLIDKDRVEVKSEFEGRRLVKGENIVIATGSSPLELPNIKFDHKFILSSDDLLELERIPKSLIIVGGGVIGCEFASLFSSLGTEVTIVELLKNLLPQEDPEISRSLETIFKKRGIRVFTEKKIEKVNLVNNGVEAFFSDNKKIEAELIQVSVGRKPNSFGLERIGLNLEGGWVVTDDFLKTNLPSIFAVGDVRGKFLLAHVAMYEGRKVVENIMGKGRELDYTAIPNCIFTFPEVASVGIKEKEIKERGIPYRVARFSFRVLGKSHTVGETEGFVKILIDKEKDIILGAHIIGPEATHIIAELTLAIKNKLKIEQVLDTIHAHPTFSEVIPEAIFSSL